MSKFIEPPDHRERLAAMRRWSTWKLGYAGWADELLAIYINPGASDERLRQECGEATR